MRQEGWNGQKSHVRQERGLRVSCRVVPRGQRSLAVALIMTRHLSRCSPRAKAPIASPQPSAMLRRGRSHLRRRPLRPSAHDVVRFSFARVRRPARRTAKGEAMQVPARPPRPPDSLLVRAMSSVNMR